MYDPNATKIYTDGSARPTNPGNGGVGIIIEFPDTIDMPTVEISEGYSLSTNNRMELLAVIRAMGWLIDNASTYKITRAIVITDSDYVHSNHGSTPYWKKQGWRTSEGKPYENPDLWDLFIKTRAKIRTPFEIRWSKGKQNDILLRVDALAKLGAANPTRNDGGYRPGKFTASRTPNKKAATLFEAGGQSLLIRVFRYGLFGRNEKCIHKITFDLYDESLQTYVGKYVAYAKVDLELKRNTCYRVILNNSRTFPQIVEAERVEYLKGVQ